MEVTFRKKLLQWFNENARQLPWRVNPNLYKTVVSEFMLQQTQVKTVLPYFERWMIKFPTIQVLAKADESDVIYNWAGLGYYSRARNLHVFAKIYCQKPIYSFAELKQIKGIGDYTASAIASIAFNEPFAVVDGNVVRVLARIFNCMVPFQSKTSAVQYFKPKAQNLLDKRYPGKFNEALMELGAICCTKQNPTCEKCPLKSLCKAFQLKTITKCPQFLPTLRTTQTRQRIWYCNQNLLLLESSNIGGKNILWELPLLTQDRKILLDEMKPIFKGKRSIGTVTYMEEILLSKVFNEPSIIFEEKPFQTCILVPLEKLNTYALSGPHRRWIQYIKSL